MSNGVAFKTSMSFTDNFTVTVDKDEIVVAFGNTTLTYQHNPDSKRYRVMTFREPPCFQIKLIGAQQILNDEVVGTGDLIFSFDTKAQHDHFQEQLEEVEYDGQF